MCNFVDIYKTYIKRDGANELLEWLQNCDFLSAPASTKYHLATEGGLATHSVHVWKRLKKLCEAEGLNYSDETIAICGLLHDVCKANYYAVDYRNAKNELGFWERVPFYKTDDQLPYGHGEKSVYIISAYMRLTREEAMAIRWHMGGFDDSVKGGSRCLSGAYEQFPLALLTHLADMQATYLDEVRD